MSLLSSLDPLPSGIESQESTESELDAAKVSVIKNEMAAALEAAARVVPVDERQKKGMSAINEHEVQFSWPPRRQNLVRRANPPVDIVCVYGSFVKV